MKVHDLSLEEAESELNARPFTAASTDNAAAATLITAAGIHYVKRKYRKKAKKFKPGSHYDTKHGSTSSDDALLAGHVVRSDLNGKYKGK